MSDPLEPFRIRARQTEPEASKQPELTEHQALKLAIEALNEIPNHRLSNGYKNTYALIPTLETTRRIQQER